MAFSFAGMANEIEITNSKEIFIEDECVQASFDAADAVQETLGIKLSPLAEGRLIIAMFEICDANR